MATRASQDSTYHLIKDSVVVYIGDAGAPPAVSSERTAYPCMSPAGERASHFAHGLTGTPQEGNSDALTAPPLEGLGEVLELGRSHWHTEYRDRVITRTDTVYRDRETVIQLPPERYVPRFYKYGTIAGVLAAVWFIVRMVLKIRKRWL